MINVKRTLYLSGPINAESIKKLTDELLALLKDDKDQQISLLINSGGGACPAAFAFYDLVKLLDVNLMTVALGDASSMAVIIFLAGKERLVAPNLTFTIHELTRSGDKGYCFTLSELKVLIKDLGQYTDMYAAVMAEKSGGTLTPEAAADMMYHERILTAEEVLKLGWATKSTLEVHA